MPDIAYYQWQNEHLLKVIYPTRKLKLIEFLVYFSEIEVWQKYKGRSPGEFPAAVKEYCDDQQRHIRQGDQLLRDLERYLQLVEVAQDAEFKARFPAPEPEVMAKITQNHRLFKHFYPRLKTVERVRFFTNGQVRELEDIDRTRRRSLGSLQRNAAVPNLTPGHLAKLQSSIKQAELALEIIDFELNKLKTFLSAFERLARYRQQLEQARSQRETRRQAALKKIGELQTELAKAQDQQAALARRERRLANPPSLAALQEYFLDDRSAGKFLDPALQPDAAAALTLLNNSFHRTFKQFYLSQTTPQLRRSFINQRILELAPLRQTRQNALAAASRAAQLAPADAAKQAALRAARAAAQAMDDEHELLSEFMAAVERQGRPADLTAPLNQLRSEKAALEERLRQAREAQSAAQAELTALDRAAAGGDLEQMVAFVSPAAVTVMDLARAEVEKLRARLDGLTHEQLLEEIVARFMAKPKDYPLWLQYMVIHFSGMRYQSAHGSWADPKDLLLALRCKKVEEEIHDQRKQGLIEAACAERHAVYQAAVGGAPLAPDADGAPYGQPPALALAKEKAALDRVRYHLRRVAPSSGFYPSRALLDLRMEEETYYVKQLSDEQALEELRGMKADLPAWMWTEIIKMTELRTTEVSRADWERLTAEEQAARDQARYAKFREILDTWKSKNITGWRQEHDRTNKLIVTRAVCNEVAEHIQHLRGHTPSGGLTAKPGWFIARSSDPRLAAARPRPLFVRIRGDKDLKVGASIFWLDWVHNQPNQWQIARPMAPPGEKDLIEVGKDAHNEIVNRGDHYVLNYRRPRTINGKAEVESGMMWLRWLHEATVAAVAETADGLTVLTFETALPHEDRRQSAIGIFKRRAVHLNYSVSPSQMIGTYTGFVPEVSLPEAEMKTLREMMDWNKVLRRAAYTPAQMDAYWRDVTVPPLPASFSLEQAWEEEFEVEVAPQLRLDGDVAEALCYPNQQGQLADSLYASPLRLRRGMRLTAAAQEGMSAEYLRVVECHGEPAAQDLYLRAADVIPLPPGPSTRPVIARQEVQLYRLSGAAPRGIRRTGDPLPPPETLPLRPVFELVERPLMAGIQAEISTVHCAGPGENGVVLGPRLKHLVLIVRCPLQPSAEGLFASQRDLKLLLKK